MCKSSVETSLCTGKETIHSSHSDVNIYDDTISLTVGEEARGLPLI